METKKAIVILCLISATTFVAANAQTMGNGTVAAGSANNVPGIGVPVQTGTFRSITNTAGTGGTGNGTGAASNNSTNATNSNNTTNTDQILILNNFPGNNFLTLAAADSLLEVRIGEIAQTNSSNPQIQQFGQTLINDHTKAYNDAKALADGMGVTLRGLNDQEQGIVQRFESLSGDAFDRVFTRFLIQGHVQDIGRFEMAASRSSNHNVRSYAATNLPVLLQHLTTLFNIREGLLGNQPLTP